ncbi:hypothetical protein KBZ18_02755 [Synechococcus sp. Cruz-9H2]|uniref:hypothetical protein n=1 Tax=unclassified Synechococcus TaxID=2626047 RepID=UPI0020CD5233|nr:MULTISPECIES: hypothetical protein [unclassified Synechococcus]MCP9818411.1 hypothetical protein [Synechococcus sp. Cruz-9H2]MCP9855304.1 hypothetical protein [Synechococcus sp. Cruz-9C9]MCP9869720.1 hypothetical protein [Synechococcus sp. Cruz-7B9]
MSSMRHRCLGPVLVITTLLAGPNGVWATGVTNDTRHDCRLWRNSRGLERVEIANRLGAANLLTKEHNFAVATPGATRSLYSSSDIRRLCALL